jgi:hypothetical protein
MEKAVQKVHGPATPEEVIQLLTDHLRAGQFYKVDAETGEPVIDLRGLQAAGLLHVVKRVGRTTSTRILEGKGRKPIEETTKRVDVELYSSKDAADLLGRFYGMDRSRPEPPAPIENARRLIVAILESGDPKARALLEAIARKALPGTGAIG